MLQDNITVLLRLLNPGKGKDSDDMQNMNSDSDWRCCYKFTMAYYVLCHMECVAVVT